VGVGVVVVAAGAAAAAKAKAKAKAVPRNTKITINPTGWIPMTVESLHRRRRFMTVRKR
jgi:hypothetical protein